MLFSQPEIRTLLSDRFECVWESVRPVPRIRIHFGGESTLEGTLHGNIATWIVSPGGDVLDILPGLYGPKPFAHHLRRLSAECARLQPLSAAAQREVIRSRLEHRTRRSAPDLGLHHAHLHEPSAWLAELALDTDATRLNLESRDNTRERLPAARRLLLEAVEPTPPALTARLYREVLDVDLEARALGLGAYFGTAQADAPTHQSGNPEHGRYERTTTPPRAQWFPR